MDDRYYYVKASTVKLLIDALRAMLDNTPQAQAQARAALAKAEMEMPHEQTTRTPQLHP